ncbi:MAG: hypothetical protein PHR28_08475 [candidate division Zixibacteria bacterium]|nr:hypothetical protein [candidate division Zixibacteria bacterium]
MPAGFMAGSNDEVLLMVDITSGPGPSVPMEVNVSGTTFRFEDGSPQINQNYLIKRSYSAFDKIMGLDLRQMRWYRVIRLAPQVVDAAIIKDGKLVVTVRITDPQYSGSGFRLYGDPVDWQSFIVTIPSFTHTSVEKFKEWGDRRIYETYGLESTASQSYVLRDGVKSVDDLSPDMGGQQGHFRIYLKVTRADFSRHYF